MSQQRYKLYCSMYGCLHSSITKPELTFFRLPTQPERLSEWLRLMCRDDLQGKGNSSNYRVCDIHFKEQDILPTPTRKMLKKNALPSLNLPDILETDQEGSQRKDKETVFVGVTTCTQSKTTTCDSYTQTTKSLFCDTHETENKTGKYQESTFHKLCDKYLTKELSLLVKSQTRLKFHVKEDRCDQDYVNFCLRLYFTSPHAYQLLQTALCLPRTATLKKSFPITTEINERAMAILKAKVAKMTEADKNCSVMIDAMALKTNLFYDIKEDTIIGFHEVEGWQSPEPAKNALVIMVRGILGNWKQPIAYALLSEYRNYDEVNKWVDKVLEKLFDVGLNIRAFVSDQGPDLMNAAKNRGVSVEKPYFFLNDRKIYYIFNATHLIKNVRNKLMQYNFHFENSVAKYEHIVQFYDHDTKKSCRLAHKLSNSHIRPTNSERIKVCYATQLLSKSVAAGVSTYVDFNIIEESGRDTVNFILNINNLFDSLNSSNLRHRNEYKRAYRGNDSQRAFYKEMLKFFQDLKLINPKNGRDCTSNAKFIEGFQITITSILLLFEDLQLEGHTFLLTRRLNKDALDKLFDRIRTKNDKATNPTCRQFKSAFRKIYFSNIMKLLKSENCVDDLEKLVLQKACEGGANICGTSTKVDEISDTNDEEFDSSVQVKSFEYNQLDMPEKKSLFYICGHLLKRCGEIHNNCQFLKLYIKGYQRSRDSKSKSCYSRYMAHSKENLQNFSTVPRDDFVEYVEKMEEIFRTSFTRKHISCKLSASIFKQIKEIAFSPPCLCFPKTYLMKLFIRMRIFYTLKYNNKDFRTFQNRRKYFSVDSL